MRKTLFAAVACLMVLSCDRNSVSTSDASGDAWVVAPRVVAGAGLNRTDLALAGVVECKATQFGGVVDSATVGYSAGGVALTIPRQDTCNFHIVGFRTADKRDTVWLGTVLLKPDAGSKQLETIPVVSSNWYLSPRFSLASGFLAGQQVLVLTDERGRKIQYRINGGDWLEYSAQIPLDSFSIVSARWSEDGRTGREAAETLDVHLVKPELSLQPGSFSTQQTLTAKSPSGDTLEISTTADKSAWKRFDAALPLNATGYAWIRATHKGSKSSVVGGQYSIAKNTDVSPLFSRDGGDVTGSLRLSVTAPANWVVQTSINGGSYEERKDSIILDSSASIKARLVSGGTYSEVVEKKYNVHLVAPGLAPAPGQYAVPQLVAAKSPSGDTLEYSTTAAKDGWTRYERAVSVGVTGYLWVRATRNGAHGDPVGGQYSIGKNTDVVPSFSNDGGAITGELNLTVSGPSGWTVETSVNGADFDTTTALIALDSFAEVTARLVRNGTYSDEVTKRYDIHFAKPVLSIAPTSLDTQQVVSATSPSGDSLEYSRNEAKTGWVTCTGPVMLDSTGYFWVRTVRAGVYKDTVGGRYVVQLNTRVHPSFSHDPKEYVGVIPLTVTGPVGWNVQVSINGGPFVATTTAIDLDSTVQLKARLVSAGTLSDEVSCAYYIHLVPPAMSPMPGTYQTRQVVSASSPSGDALEYSRSQAKVDWKPVQGPIPVDSTGYLWVRGAYGTQKTDPVGGLFQIKKDSTFAGMRVIPAGSFRVALAANSSVSVSISSFLMDSAEVTQKDFKSLLGRNPSAFPWIPEDSLAVFPVENLTWYDAIAYCNARSARDGLSPVYAYQSPEADNTGSIISVVGLTADFSRNGYRLPTDAEWEYAYRAGTATAYYWGDASDNATVLKYGWFDPTDVASTQAPHSVARLVRNDWGLYDMPGNVAEWTNDWYGEAYPNPVDGTKSTDPSGSAAEDADYPGMKVVRGGGYSATTSALLSAAGSRSMQDAGVGALATGFRCVRRVGQ